MGIALAVALLTTITTRNVPSVLSARASYKRDTSSSGVARIFVRRGLSYVFTLRHRSTGVKGRT